MVSDAAKIVAQPGVPQGLLLIAAGLGAYYLINKAVNVVPGAIGDAAGAVAGVVQDAAGAIAGAAQDLGGGIADFGGGFVGGAETTRTPITSFAFANDRSRIFQVEAPNPSGGNVAPTPVFGVPQPGTYDYTYVVEDLGQFVTVISGNPNPGIPLANYFEIETPSLARRVGSEVGSQFALPEFITAGRGVYTAGRAVYDADRFLNRQIDKVLGWINPFN